MKLVKFSLYSDAKARTRVVSECPDAFAPFATYWSRLYFQRCLKGFVKTTSAHLKRQRVAVTERVIDVLARLLCGRSTVDLVVSQRFQWNTLSVTESYLNVLQNSAQQLLALCTVHANTKNTIQTLTPLNQSQSIRALSTGLRIFKQYSEYRYRVTLNNALSHTCTVVRECCKDNKSLWERAKCDPATPKPLNPSPPKLHS